MNKDRPTEQELLLKVRQLEQQQDDIQSRMKELNRQVEEDSAQYRNQYVLSEHMRERYADDPRVQQAINDKQSILNVMQKECVDHLEEMKKGGNLQVRKLSNQVENIYQEIHHLQREEG